jgi:hypothetical protein
MKKCITVLLTIGVLLFFACGNDDDNNTQECQICSFGIDEEIEEEVIVEFCDNGDGTVTIKADGEEVTESLDGATFNEFILALEIFGADCN